MSRTMNQKAATTKSKRSISRQPVAEPPHELSGVEKAFEQIKPHLTTIALAVVAGLLGFIVIAFIMRNRFDQNALQWRELNNASSIALRTGDVNGLKQVAANNPETRAGLWALQMAGDQQLRMGLEQLSTDREAGLGLIRKSKENLQSVVDAPSSAKTTMLERRSHFSLAYACESLGEFADAKALYQELVDEAPDSAFADPARRGINRCSNPDYADLYAKFETFEEKVIGDAPGPALPERPSIDFPEIDLPPGQKPGTEKATDPSAETDPSKTGEAPAKTESDPKVDATGNQGATDEGSKANTDPAGGGKEPASETPPTEKPADKSDVELPNPAKTDGDNQ